jgi:MFS family permease
VDYVRSLRPRLPRDVYVLQAGLVINAFGNGAGNPFLVIYLHNLRGFRLALAGLVGTTSATCALIAAGLAGYLADRYSARITMIAGLILSATGWTLYPLVHKPWEALIAAIFTGAGVGTWLTMQSTVLALVTPAAVRHAAFAQQRVAANLGLGFGGLTAGLIVTTARPATFSTIFVLNAATFLVYTVFVARLRIPRAIAPRIRAGYREVLRDKAFRRVALLNLGYVAISVALVGSMFPVFARNYTGASERLIGLLFLVNSLLIIVAQMPIARAIEGHRRVKTLAVTCVAFAGTWAFVELAGVVSAGRVAIVLLFAAFAVLSIGECLYDATYGPLVADLAPEGRTGRYMATSGLSWQVALIAVPATSGAILGAAPLLLWPLAIALSLVLVIASLRLEPHLPVNARRTPIPD